MSNDVATIRINDIEIGSLPLAQYQDVRRQVYRRPWLYLRQLVNVLRCMGMTGWLILRCQPVLWFTVGVFLLLANPAALAASIDLFHSAPGGEVVSAIKKGLSLSLQFTSVVMLMISVGFSHWFCRVVGFNNVFETETNYQIRALLEAPAEGDMSVDVSVSGTQHGQQ